MWEWMYWRVASTILRLWVINLFLVLVLPSSSSSSLSSVHPFFVVCTCKGGKMLMYDEWTRSLQCRVTDSSWHSQHRCRCRRQRQHHSLLGIVAALTMPLLHEWVSYSSFCAVSADLWMLLHCLHSICSWELLHSCSFLSVTAKLYAKNKTPLLQLMHDVCVSVRVVLTFTTIKRTVAIKQNV